MDIPESLEKEVSKLENVISKFEEAAERIDGLCRELVALNQLDRSSEVGEVQSQRSGPPSLLRHILAVRRRGHFR